MIARTKTGATPAILTGARCRNSLQQIVAAAPAQRQSLIKQNIYASRSVVTKLTQVYKKKCAYCESPEEKPEIDHYRPKGSHLGQHTGYYWLCYEWSNLLPSCHDCNSTHKTVRFPIIGGRTTAPLLIGALPCPLTSHVTSVALLRTENPSLLHPEIPGFDPFNYFSFSKWGKMIPKRGLRRNSHSFIKARQTIDVTSLNRYKMFNQYRQRELRKLQKELRFLLFQFLRGYLTGVGLRNAYEKKLGDIKSMSHKDQPYSFFWKYVYTKLEDVYLKHYFKRPAQLTLFVELTKQFKRNNP